MKHYVRLSNCTTDFLIADTGSSLNNDVGTMGGYDSILLDRKDYMYNCYHFAAASLGSVLLKTVQASSQPRSSFAKPATVRVQPVVTNLLAADDTDADYTSLLPPLSPLNWDFSL